MNNLEQNLLSLLIDLKENHNVIGIKAEFENEGTSTSEAQKLKEILTSAKLDLTIKIGGCGAIKDIYEAKLIGANSIVAPMIETPYALQKYIDAINFVFSENEKQKLNFLINIETITAFENFDNILSSPYFENLSGIVLGRADMIASMNSTKNNINDEQILKIAKNISIKMKSTGKNMLIGGGVSAKSLAFFEQLPYLSFFETRKVIFDAKQTLNDKNSKQAILKALAFELMWLENKQELYGIPYHDDIIRITKLKSYYKQLNNQINVPISL